ncbi:MAG: sulfatase [Pirellulales bacterium]|nr:sulfatase [Pirellulales bacterium]
MLRGIFTSTWIVLTLVTAAVAAPAPNVVFIYCDDLGYGDLGVYGATGYQTPHLDRLAAEGIRFTRFYTAQPVCSASRVALLTGCYPSRVGIHGALGPQAAIGIHERETTLGELCHARGYATGVFGKWHLGHHRPFLPLQNGFDEYFGLPYSNDMWPYHPEFRGRRGGFPDLPLLEGNEAQIAAVTSEDQRHLTTWYTEHAVDFIERHREQPFFVYLAHSMPHVPLHVSDKFAGHTERGLYGDVIEEIDWSVGQIMSTLARLGLDERTLVMFSSDNGPWLSYGEHAGSAGPLREGKGTCWEGGVREPFVARWPGRIPRGAVCDEPAMTLDILPTVAGLIGAALPEQPIDGLDIWPLISGQAGARSPHEAFYFYFKQNELHAVLSGNWKLYLPHEYRSLPAGPKATGGVPVRYESRTLELPELYDVVADIGETRNVAAEQQQVVERLLTYAERARAELGDTLTKRTGSGFRPPGRVEKSTER